MKKPSLDTIRLAERDNSRFALMKRIESSTKMVQNLGALPNDHRVLAVAWQLAVLEPEEQLRVIKFFSVVDKENVSKLMEPEKPC